MKMEKIIILKIKYAQKLFQYENIIKIFIIKKIYKLVLLK